MSSFVIKLIAIITMLCDHSGDAIIGHFSILNIIGRIAFPLFCFQIVVGYKHTKNVKKYLTAYWLLWYHIQAVEYGLKCEVTEITENLHLHSIAGKERCDRIMALVDKWQGLSNCQLMQFRQMKICFIKSHSMTHTEVLSAKMDSAIKSYL